MSFIGSLKKCERHNMKVESTAIQQNLIEDHVSSSHDTVCAPIQATAMVGFTT